MCAIAHSQAGCPRSFCWKRTVPGLAVRHRRQTPGGDPPAPPVPRCTRRGWRLFRGYALPAYTCSYGSGSGDGGRGNWGRGTENELAHIAPVFILAVQGCWHFIREPIPLIIQQALHGPPRRAIWKACRGKTHSSRITAGFTLSIVGMKVAHESNRAWSWKHQKTLLVRLSMDHPLPDGTIWRAVIALGWFTHQAPRSHNSKNKSRRVGFQPTHPAKRDIMRFAHSQVGCLRSVLPPHPGRYPDVTASGVGWAPHDDSVSTWRGDFTHNGVPSLIDPAPGQQICRALADADIAKGNRLHAPFANLLLRTPAVADFPLFRWKSIS